MGPTEGLWDGSDGTWLVTGKGHPGLGSGERVGVGWDKSRGPSRGLLGMSTWERTARAEVGAAHMVASGQSQPGCES